MKGNGRETMYDTRDFKVCDVKTIRNIIDNYNQNEKALVNQLYFKAGHGPTIGGFREDIWRGMFAQIVPKKFVIEQSVFILDSKGRVSNEVDLAIFDETYTPYIFRYGKLKFLPIEAVAVVIECKSTSLDQVILKNWAESIAALKTSRESYARMFGTIVNGIPDDNVKEGESPAPSTQTATRPLRILCCLNKDIINENLGSGDKLFDFVIRASEENQDFKIEIEVDDSKDSLQDWYRVLNHADDAQKNGTENDGSGLKNTKLQDYQVKHNEKLVSLLTFNLQLNQILMLINNPILFPHKAYADIFNNFELEGNHE
jgi:cell fate (sporulation/competence/biofilm development) regulator YlbF (YheA/YmcA/DUF963 family)